MNFLEEVHAKSLTFSASKVQVFLFFDLDFSAFLASSSVTISIGSLVFCAFCHLANCSAVKTSEKFFPEPVEATI